MKLIGYLALKKTSIFSKTTQLHMLHNLEVIALSQYLLGLLQTLMEKITLLKTISFTYFLTLK